MREESHLQTPWGLACPLTRGTLSPVNHHHKFLVHPGSSCAVDQSQSILCPVSSPVPAQEGTGQKNPCLCCRADNLSRAPGGSHSAQHPLPAPGSRALLQAGREQRGHGGRGGQASPRWKFPEEWAPQGQSCTPSPGIGDGSGDSSLWSSSWPKHSDRECLQGLSLLFSLSPRPLLCIGISPCTQRGDHGMLFSSFSSSVPVVPQSWLSRQGLVPFLFLIADVLLLI